MVSASSTQRGVFAGFAILGTWAVFLVPSAEAHVPVLVEQESLADVYLIDDPDLSQAFYGELDNFPHTYEIRAREPFTIFAQILAPDIEGVKDNIAGIIIKLPEKRGRVEEVTRMKAEGEWPVEYEPFGGDTYRMGPAFERELGPGTYRIEVHTADNLEKYVLVVGKREEMTIGYFELVGRLMEVKVFFGKSKLRVVESPYVYVPLLLIVLAGFGTWYWRRRTLPIAP